jgi:hypothetical protein
MIIKYVSTFVNKVENPYVITRTFDLIDICRYVFYGYGGRICPSFQRTISGNSNFKFIEHKSHNSLNLGLKFWWWALNLNRRSPCKQQNNRGFQNWGRSDRTCRRLLVPRIQDRRERRNTLGHSAKDKQSQRCILQAKKRLECKQHQLAPQN